jgi:hypothetical protein
MWTPITYAVNSECPRFVPVLQCDRCGGRMRIVCSNHPPEAIRSILDCLGLPTRPPPIAAAVSGIDDPPLVSADGEARIW